MMAHGAAFANRPYSKHTYVCKPNGGILIGINRCSDEDETLLFVPWSCQWLSLGSPLVTNGALFWPTAAIPLQLSLKAV